MLEFSYFFNFFIGFNLRSNSISLVMMAAGNSSRFCSNGMGIKKQWLRSDKSPLWLLATDRLAKFFSFKSVIITASRQDLAYMQKLSSYHIVLGGDSRCDSLRNALKHIDSEFVLVSDVARWDCDLQVVESMLKAIEDEFSCIVPYVGVSDTAFYENRFLNRDEIRLIQTPQLSKVGDLKKALESKSDFSDESSAMHSINKKIKFIKGSKSMAKITFADDLDTHKYKLKPPSKDNFIGFGIDIHGFVENKKMMLCGIELESNLGFKAHSDGDVGIHAIIDAMLGAMNCGDIGEWFPDNDKAYKNADSALLLKTINEYAMSVGFVINNLDLTIIAQKPKISPYKNAMQEKLAQILNIQKSQINIKATTAESLGFIGRKEGVCVQCVANMKLFDWTLY